MSNLRPSWSGLRWPGFGCVVLLGMLSLAHASYSEQEGNDDLPPAKRYKVTKSQGRFFYLKMSGGELHLISSHPPSECTSEDDISLSSSAESSVSNDLDNEERQCSVELPLELYPHIARHSGLAACAALASTCRDLYKMRFSLFRECQAVFELHNIPTILFDAYVRKLTFKHVTFLGDATLPVFNLEYLSDWDLCQGTVVLDSLTLEAPRPQIAHLPKIAVQNLHLKSCKISVKAFEKLMAVSPKVESLALEHVMPRNNWTDCTNGYFAALVSFLPPQLQTLTLSGGCIGLHPNPLSFARIQASFAAMAQLKHMTIQEDTSLLTKYDGWHSEDKTVLALLLRHTPHLESLVLADCGIRRIQLPRKLPQREKVTIQ
ncbi:MAG: hypothetical protein ACK5O7_03720 [Holosporales bacterium]